MMNADDQRRYWGMQALMNAMDVIRFAAPCNQRGEEIAELAEAAVVVAELLRQPALSDMGTAKLDAAIGRTSALMRQMESTPPTPRRTMMARLFRRRPAKAHQRNALA